MPKWKVPWHLNIRQKVIVGLSAGLISIGAIGVISYLYLREIEFKQYVVEIADDLNHITLEMRRYEKNYLLYGSPEDFQENRRYTQQALEVLEQISPEVRNLKVEPKLKLFQQELLAYARLMEHSPLHSGRLLHDNHPEWEEQLRERGKALVDLSQTVVAFERQRILEILHTLKTQLGASVVIFLVIGISFTYIVSQKIVKPLGTIEHTTLRIARGDFRPLPVLETYDETQRVVEAFNRMVKELEKRQHLLVQAKKMSSLGVLTAGIAHQLNNPLNNISTSCQIILEELEAGEVDFFKEAPHQCGTGS